MLDLWWIYGAGEAWVDDWCASRRHWLESVPTDSDAVFSQLLRRHVLSRYVAQPAANLKFTRGEKGKPQLVDARCHFNVSHSAGWHVVLVSDLPCGVDVESWQRSVAGLRRPNRMKRFPEAALLQQQDDAGVLRYWTMKEARAKQAGESLWQQLQQPLVLSQGQWRVPDGLFAGHVDIGACVAWVATSATPVRVRQVPQLA